MMRPSMVRSGRSRNPVLEVRGLTFTYPGTDSPVLSDVSFTLEQGGALGIVGRPGSGKTTLCMALAGFAPALTGGSVQGEILVCGRHPRGTGRTPRARLQIGMIFDDFAAQLTQLKVIDEIMIPLRARGLPEKEAHAKARQLLERLALDERVAGGHVWDLCAGEQQRLAIGAMLAAEPDVMIFDSALESLDPRGRELLVDLIAELQAERTVIVVEQDPGALAQLVDELLVLEDGRVAASGDAASLLRDEDLLARADVEWPASSPNRSLRLHDDSALGPPAASTRPVASPQKPRKPLLLIDGATYVYEGQSRAVDDVSLRVRAGEVHAIVGNSGAGKTTLVKLIAGLLQPRSGRVRICGNDIRSKSAADVATVVGTVPQNPDEQICERTVADEIAAPLRERQVERQGLFSRKKRYDDHHIRKQVSRACKLVGIDDSLLDSDPVLLPRPTRKLVTIAEAVATDRRVVVLDEPLSGLGAAGRRAVHRLIGELRESGKAVVIVDNDLQRVETLADTVTILDHGRVQYQGPVQGAG